MTASERPSKGRPRQDAKDLRHRPISDLGKTPWRRDRKGTVTAYRYYVIGAKPRVWLGFDKAEAIAKLRQWQSQQTRDVITITEDRPQHEMDAVRDTLENDPTAPLPEWFNQAMAEAHDAYDHSDPASRYDPSPEIITHRIGSAAWWETVRRQIAIDPVEAERRLNVRFADPFAVKAPLRLGTVARVETNRRVEWIVDGITDESKLDPKRPKSVFRYWKNLKRRRPINTQSQSYKEAAREWSRFCEFVGVATCEPITEDRIEAFYHHVLTRSTNHDTVYNIFYYITSIFSAAESENSSAAQIAGWCRKHLVAPGESKESKRPMTREEFAKMIGAIRAAGDLKFETAVTLALNGSLYPSDCEQFLHTDIDWKTASVQNNRTKTRVERCFCLFPEVVSLLKRYMASEDYKKRDKRQMQPAEKAYADFLFGWNRKRFAKRWVEYRRAAGLPEEIGFNSLRDSNMTIVAGDAITDDEAGMDRARVIAGHKIRGEVDKYFKRHYSKIKASCELVRQEMGIPALHKTPRGKK